MKLIHRSEVGLVLNGAKKILDIGGGHRPFPLATTIVDKMPDEVLYAGKVHQENVGAKIKNISGAEFLKGDITDLSMFGKNQFDFVFCSHVIEHVEDIEKALSEITRVAPRGYLECPRGWFEYIDGSPFHKWAIDFDGTRLLFRKKNKKEFYFQEKRRLFDLSKTIFHRLYNHDDANVMQGIDRDSKKWLRKIRTFFSPGKYPPYDIQRDNKTFAAITLYWEEKIDYSIVHPYEYL